MFSRRYATLGYFLPKSGDESPGYILRPLARTILAAIEAIERSPALQRGFDNRKSNTASHSDARIQSNKCYSSIRCDACRFNRRDATTDPFSTETQR
jgi:hypothetical protein